MDGKHTYRDDEYPAEEFRTWRLCTLLHKAPSELEDESAARLDWLLAVDDQVARYRREQEEKRNG